MSFTVMYQQLKTLRDNVYVGQIQFVTNEKLLTVCCYNAAT